MFIIRPKSLLTVAHLFYFYSPTEKLGLIFVFILEPSLTFLLQSLCTNEGMLFQPYHGFLFVAFPDASCFKYILIINEKRYFQCIERENYFDIVNEYRMFLGRYKFLHTILNCNQVNFYFASLQNVHIK